ncbi:MAG: long-chain fatty acid--CoA ligase [Acidimicrobiia bacterium]|nr:long-chain fatty acid--CoA ligase [Acidimicrobiia bacterium]
MAQWTDEQIDAATAGQTVASRFRDTVRACPDRVALRCKAGEGWNETTFGEFADQACRVATGLSALGVTRGDRVVLMMRNRPEFHVADIAVVLLGATPISIYNSSSADQIRYLAGHCEASIAIVEDEGYLNRMLEVRADLPQVREIAVIDVPDAGAPEGVRTWAELLDSEPGDLDTLAAIAQPSDLATVIYTSGTTGPPKGVMIDHANVAWTMKSLWETLSEVDLQNARLVSYLPMAHIAERNVSHYLALSFGYEVTTCPVPGEVAQYLPEVRPQVFFAVPRVWEKIHAGVMAMAGADPERKAQLDEALAVGLRAAEHRARGEELPADLAAAFATADEALGMVRGLLGLDACVSAISGAAPIAVEIFNFFRGLGVPLSEVYGMSETTGIMTFDPFAVRAGTVGRAVPGSMLRLADDGEVLTRGGQVFRGYLDDPEKTAEALDADGWLHSGDIGVLDDDGYLTIVDRKKELIITAGGKNISPANLESALKAQPLIGQVCVIGDQRPFISALVVLDPDVAPVWAKAHRIDASDPAALADDPDVLAEVDRQVAAAMEPFNNAERVKKVTVLHREWMPDSEELTPTSKLKRRGIHAKYDTEIEALYG